MITSFVQTFQKGPAMTTQPLPEALESPLWLIATLEQHQAELPFAADALLILLPLQQHLATQRAAGEQAIDCWRESLARRWQAEVAAQRAYDHARRVPTAAATRPTKLALNASELLDELCQLRRDLSNAAAPDERLLHRLADACTALASTIETAGHHEAKRREALRGYQDTRQYCAQASQQIYERLVEQWGHERVRQLSADGEQRLGEAS